MAPQSRHRRRDVDEGDPGDPAHVRDVDELLALADDLDEAEGAEPDDDASDEEALPPARAKSYSTKPGPPHRQAGPPRVAAAPQERVLSPWEGKDRATFSTAMASRQDAMRNSREALKVKGLTVDR